MPPLEQVGDLAKYEEVSAPDVERDGGSVRAGVRLLLSLSLPTDRTAPGRAREAVRDIPELDAIRDDATLVVTELVTNAVRHSGATDGDQITLTLHVNDERVTIQVQDPARTDLTPRVRNLRSQEPGGLGLRLVSRIARRWDTERRNGRIVWADLPWRDAAPPHVRASTG